MNFASKIIKSWISKVLFIIGISIVAFYFDKKLNYTNEGLKEVTKYFLTTITVIAGILITYYLIFIQTYKDRYPIKIIRKEYLPNIKVNFIIIIYVVVYGNFVIFIDNYGIINISFCILSIIVLVVVFENIYSANKSLMINSYVDDFCGIIEKQLNKTNSDISDSTLHDIKQILDESIVKEEYFVAQNITEKTGNIFTAFLSNSIKVQMNPEEINIVFDKIVDLNIYQLELCKHIKSELLVNKIIKQQNSNFKFCIDNRQFEWFKVYLKAFNKFIFKVQLNGNFHNFDKVYSIYHDLYDILVLTNKLDLTTYLLEELESLTKELSFIKDNFNLTIYVRFMIYTIINYSEKESKNLLKLLFCYLGNLIEIVNKISNEFDKSIPYFVLVFNALVKLEFAKAIEFYEMFFKKHMYLEGSSSFYNFKIYCIDTLIKCDNENDKEKIYKFHLEH